MAITIIDPGQEGAQVSAEGTTRLLADITSPSSVGDVTWTVAINGGSPQSITTGVSGIAFSWAKVLSADGSGNKGVDTLVFACTDTTTSESGNRTTYWLQGPPRINCTNPAPSRPGSSITTLIPTPSPGPTGSLPAGPADTSMPTGAVADEDNAPGTGLGCGCPSHEGGGGG